MRYSVDRKTLDRAVRCDKDFRCMEEESDEPGAVICEIGTNILVTLCGLRPWCPYFRPIRGIEGFCTCPARIELYKNYGI